MIITAAAEPARRYTWSDGTVVEHVSTHALAAGDVIMDHGMRIVLGELGGERTDRYGRCVWFPGDVTNRAEFAPGARQADPFIWHHTAEGWTVQGNEHATWVRVVSEPETETDYQRAMTRADEQAAWDSIDR